MIDDAGCAITTMSFTQEDFLKEWATFYQEDQNINHVIFGKAVGAVAGDQVRLIDATQSSTSEDEHSADKALDRNTDTFTHSTKEGDI